MAHMIDFSNNRSNIAFVGEKPWHGLGQELEINTPLEMWAEKAGFNWEAKKAQVQYNVDGEVYESDKQIIYRSDTKLDLGVCKDRYQIVQPMDVLEFYRDIVELEGWHIEVAGVLDGGKRLWALAKTGDQFDVNGTVDRVNTYLLLATSYDGTMATIGKFTSVRVVCQNTLTMSLGDRIASVRVPHSREFNPAAMKAELGIHTEATKQFMEEAAALAQRKTTDKEAMKFIIDILHGKDDKIEDISTRKANIIKSVYDLYDGKGMGSSLPSANGTAWGVLNAITEYTNHHVNSRSVNNRVRAAWFGTNEQLGLNAKEILLKAA